MRRWCLGDSLDDTVMRFACRSHTAVGKRNVLPESNRTPFIVVVKVKSFHFISRRLRGVNTIATSFFLGSSEPNTREVQLRP
jgi:hypothetical protein